MSADDATEKEVLRINKKIGKLNAEKQRLTAEKVHVPNYREFLYAKPLYEMSDGDYRINATSVIVPDLLYAEAPPGSLPYLRKRLIAHSLGVKYSSGGSCAVRYFHVRGTLSNTIKHIIMLSEMLLAGGVRRQLVKASFDLLFCVVFDNCYNTTEFHGRHSTALYELSMMNPSVEQLIVFWFDYLDFIKNLNAEGLEGAPLFRLDLAIDYFIKKVFMQRSYHRGESPFEFSQHRELYFKLDGEQKTTEAVMGFKTSSPSCPFKWHAEWD